MDHLTGAYEINAPAGQDYFYRVLTVRQHVAAVLPVRNLVGFSFQLQAGADIYPVRSAGLDLNRDVDQLTAAELAAGYTIGVKLSRYSTNQGSLGILHFSTP